MSNFFVGYLAEGVGTGSSFVENTASGYARQPVTLASLVYGRTKLVSGVTFGPAGGAYIVTQRALFDAVTAGNCLQYWTLHTQPTVAVGGTDTLNAGSLAHFYPDLVNAAGGNALFWAAGAQVGTTNEGAPIYAGVSLAYTGGSVEAGATAGLGGGGGGSQGATGQTGPAGPSLAINTFGTVTTVLPTDTVAVYSAGANSEITAKNLSTVVATINAPTQVQAVGHKVGNTGNGNSYLNAYTWTLAAFSHIMGPQGASDIQLQYGNYSGAAVPEANPNVVTVQAELIYNGVSYPVLFSSDTAGTNPNSVVIQGGGLVTSDPVPVNIPAGATYMTRTLASVPTVGLNIPQCRNTQPQNGEMLLYGTTSTPATPLGADLTTSAATASGGTTLTFSSTTVTAFGSSVLYVGGPVRGAGIYPGTTIASFTGTTITLSQGVAAAGVASGAVVHVGSVRPGLGNSVGAMGPLNILGRVKTRTPAILMFGDSKLAGKFVSATLTTTGAASGNVLTFASTALSGGAVMYPGIDVPAWNNTGVPAGTVVGSFTSNTVTLVNGVTGAAVTLTGAALNSGTVFTFGQQCDLIGNSGFMERGLVSGFGTASPLPAYPWCNAGVSGDSLFWFSTLSNGISRLKLLSQGFTHAVDEYGINDFSSGFYTTFSAFQTAKLAFWNLLASYGLKVVACTIAAETTSTDGWVTTGNQAARSAAFATSTAVGTTGTNSQDQQYNDWIRTLPSPLVGIVDAADAQMSARDSQLWPTFSVGGTAYPAVAASSGYVGTADGTHDIGIGQVTIAAKVNAAVLAGVFNT